MSHLTLQKFDEEKNTIKEYTYWKVLIHSKPKTLGQCVVIIKRDVRKLSELTLEEMIEFHTVVQELERALQQAFQYDKINWFLAMMKDPQVHFHVIPRYATTRVFEGKEYTDLFLDCTDPLQLPELDSNREESTVIKEAVKRNIL